MHEKRNTTKQIRKVNKSNRSPVSAICLASFKGPKGASNRCHLCNHLGGQNNPTSAGENPIKDTGPHSLSF